MSEPTRLYGIPGADVLYLTLEEAYRHQVWPWADEHDRRPHQIEEWSVKPKRDALPSADAVIDMIVDLWGDEFITEAHFDAACDAAPKRAIEQVLAAWAEAIRYEVADEHISTYVVEWDTDGDPLVNGVPLYPEDAA